MLLRFANAHHRAEFLKRLRDEEPELYALAKASFAQPDIVSIRQASDLAETRIRALARATKVLKIHEDVQMRILDAG